MFSAKEYKELMKLLPQLSKDVVNLPSLLKAGAGSLARAARSKNREDDLKNLEVLQDDSLLIVDKLSTESALVPSCINRFMQLYFDQLSLQRVHFDFRSARFSSEGEKLIWSPSKLSHAFSEKFSEGVQQLYNAFYADNLIEFKQALMKLDIVQSQQSSEVQDELTQLFFEHFGDAQKGPVLLTLAKFQDSFQKIFEGFKKHNIQVSNDFAFLGAYLASLYSHMDELNQEVDVRQAFVNSKLSTI